MARSQTRFAATVLKGAVSNPATARNPSGSFSHPRPGVRAVLGQVHQQRFTELNFIHLPVPMDAGRFALGATVAHSCKILPHVQSCGFRESP